MSSFLDALLFGIRKIFLAGVEQSSSVGLDFIGPGWELGSGTDGSGARKITVAYKPTGEIVAAGALQNYRLNEAVAASATSSNNDLLIPPSTTYHVLVDVKMEDSGGTRSQALRRLTIVRSGTGSPVIVSTVNDVAPSGFTLNTVISINVLRTTCTKAAGTSARIDTRTYVERSYPTVEFS